MSTASACASAANSRAFPDLMPHETPCRRVLTGAGGARLLALVLLALLVVGCATVTDRHPTAEDARERGRDAEQAGYTYGHGTGGTPEEARTSALQEIASEVVVAVRGEQQEIFRSLRRRGEIPEDEAELETEMELTSTIASLTHVELEGAELDGEERVREGWYVRMRIPSHRMDTLRARARRNAPALAQFELVENVPDGEPGRRFRLALSGLDTADRTGVKDERLYTPEIGETTFGSYFENAARESAQRIQVIPEIDGRRVRFAVVDRETLQPQPRLAIRVGNQELVTNSQGWTGSRDVRDLPRETRVLLVGEPGTSPRLSEGNRRLETFYPQDWRSPPSATLYVHSAPPGAILEVDGVQYEAPARVSVRPGSRYDVRFFGTEEYRGQTTTVEVPEESPSAYLSERLTERRYGHVRLTADGNSVIELRGPQELELESIERALETARYEVTVRRRDGNRRYQEVTDEIVLRRDETVRRHYEEPRDREPYYYGWRWGLSLAYLGGEPGDEYRIPWGDGEEAFGDIDNISASSLNFLLGVQGQYFANATPLTVSGSLAYGIAEYDLELEGAFGTTQNVEEDLATTQITAGIGLWRPLAGGDVIGWATVNRAWDSSRWRDRDGAASQLPGGSVRNEYNYLEIGAHADAYSLSARIADDDGLRPMLIFAFGATSMERGFNHPPRVQAQSGVHYTSD